MTIEMAPEATRSRRGRFGSYLFFFICFASILFATHIAYIGLPYYWDEAGQFIPAALDIFHGGNWIAHSAVPNVHPPAVAAYLAAAWTVAGLHPAVTRAAMLLVASFAMLATFLLSIELSKNARGAPAFLAAGLMLACPLFFAQSMLAQLDAPAMLFTALALLWFLQDRIPLAAAACLVLALVKETGLVAAMTFAGWLAYERRWREAACFLAPLIVLLGWIAILIRATGYWAGNQDFVRYNLYYPLHPVRLVVDALRRLYYLCFANMHWIGAAAILLAWRSSRLFHSRGWRIAWLLAAAQVALVTVLGGATLERYLLPAMPIVYTAMAAALQNLRAVPRILGSAALLLGLAASNLINPPYPFAYEDNLAFTDFVRVQAQAAEYIERCYPLARVYTAWPLTAELSRPELGFVKRRVAVHAMRDFAPATFEGLNWRAVPVLAAYSRRWNPAWSAMRYGPVHRFWARFFGYRPDLEPKEIASRIPFPAAAHFERRGQWIDIYVNTGKERSAPEGQIAGMATGESRAPNSSVPGSREGE